MQSKSDNPRTTPEPLPRSDLEMLVASAKAERVKSADRATIFENLTYRYAVGSRYQNERLYDWTNRVRDAFDHLSDVLDEIIVEAGDVASGQ